MTFTNLQPFLMLHDKKFGMNCVCRATSEMAEVTYFPLKYALTAILAALAAWSLYFGLLGLAKA